MSIMWTDGPNAGVPLFEGAVLYVGCRDVRVMSDVWDSESYATVWDEDRVRDVVLSDFIYVAKDGGWTREYEEAADGEWVASQYDETGAGFFKKQSRHLHAIAQVDATPEVLAEVAEYNRLNHAIEGTRRRLREAVLVRSHREVEVFKGRKVPLGDDYEATNHPQEGMYGVSVHLRNRKGERFSFVNIDNLRVIRPERYVEGAVACGTCRREFSSVAEAGMLAGEWADGECRDCRLEGVLDGRRDVAMPKGAVHPHFSPFKDRPSMRGTGTGEALVRDIFAEPDDLTNWLVFCDWLEEEQGDEARANGLREAINGKAKVKAPSIRKKDLKVTPWERKTLQGWMEVYECIITGFPPAKEYDAVAARVIVRLGDASRATFTPHKTEGEMDKSHAYRNIIKGTLLRQCKAVLPPLVVGEQEPAAVAG